MDACANLPIAADEHVHAYEYVQYPQSTVMPSQYTCGHR